LNKKYKKEKGRYWREGIRECKPFIRDPRYNSYDDNTINSQNPTSDPNLMPFPLFMQRRQTQMNKKVQGENSTIPEWYEKELTE